MTFRRAAWLDGLVFAAALLLLAFGRHINRGGTS